MEASKTSRFGKKAMSLFLSGAMVMAFAPAVAAPAAQALSENDSPVNITTEGVKTAKGAEEKVGVDGATAKVTWVSGTKVKVEVTGATNKDATGELSFAYDPDGIDTTYSPVAFANGAEVELPADAVTAIGSSAPGTVTVGWTTGAAAGAADLFKAATVTGVEVDGAPVSPANKKVKIKRKAIYDGTGKILMAAVASVDVPGEGPVATDKKGLWKTELYITPDGSSPIGDDARVKSGGPTKVSEKAGLSSLTGEAKLWLVVTGEDQDKTDDEANRFDGLSAAIEVELEGESLDGAEYYKVNAKDAYDLSGTGFTWNGKNLKGGFGVKLGGAALEAYDEGTGNGDYEVKFVNQATQQEVSGDLTAAGSYRAILTGRGDYEGATKQIAFEVGKLDLSKAEIKLKAEESVVSVDSITPAGEEEAADIAGIDFQLTATGDMYQAGAVGSFPYTVALKASDTVNSANIEGTGTAAYESDKEATITYENAVFESGKDGSTVKIDLSKEDKVVYSKSYFKATGEGIASDAVTGAMLKVEVTDAKTGEKADESALQTAGTWDVKVSVDGAAAEYQYKGSAKFTFVIKNGDVGLVSATYDGKDFDKDTKAYTDATYTGEDLASKVRITALDSTGKKTLAAGTDYEVKVTYKGKETASVVDAGEYTYTVMGKGYELATPMEFKLTVGAVTPAVAEANYGKDASGNDRTAYTYTGEAIAPQLTFYKESKKNENKVSVPAEAYKVTSIKYEKPDGTDQSGAAKYKAAKTVDAVKDAGKYTVQISADNSYAGKGNYNLGTVVDNYNITVMVAPAAIGDAVLDGERVGTGYSSFRYDYTGEAVVPVVKAYDKPVTATDAEEVAVPADALKVSIVKHNSDDTNTTVDEIKGAGTYTVAYSLDKKKAGVNYEWDGKEFTVRVGKPAIAHIEVDPALFTDKAIVAYTGKAIAPTYRFWTANPATSTKAEQVELGAGSYSVSYLFSQSIDASGNLVAPKAVSEILEVGYYQPIFLDLNEDDEYVFGTTTLPGGRLIQVAQASDATKVTQMTRKVSKVTPAKKTVKGVKKGKLKAKKTFKLKATVTGDKTSVTFAKANKAGGSKIAVSKAGKVTVKKGVKKGTYKVKVKATAKATATYKAATKTVTVKITVK